jgi:ubiquinone/menaquinone biosynthesis C-methylase UbiE
MMPVSVESLRQRFYPDASASDPIAQFTACLDRLVKPTDVVLDIGAGAGELNAHRLKGRASRVIGIDVDSRVGGNRQLDSGVRGDICELPFQGSSFDTALSIYVFEHVDRPAELASEIYRVLRPGGLCVSLTPNAFHYATLASRFSPLWFHRWFNERRGRSAEDTFPTRYRLNSRRALTRYFTQAGFETVSIDAIEVQPNYLTATAGTFALGIAYERLVNAADLLSAFRVNLIATFRKPR